jgi:hypothetical protein
MMLVSEADLFDGFRIHRLAVNHVAVQNLPNQ